MAAETAPLWAPPGDKLKLLLDAILHYASQYRTIDSSHVGSCRSGFQSSQSLIDTPIKPVMSQKKHTVNRNRPACDRSHFIGPETKEKKRNSGPFPFHLLPAIIGIRKPGRGNVSQTPGKYDVRMYQHSPVHRQTVCLSKNRLEVSTFQSQIFAKY